MNSKLAVAIVFAIIVLGSGAFLLTRHHASPTSKGSANSSASKTPYKQANACDLFPQAVASQVLGQGAVKSNSVNTDESTSDVAVTTCTYDNTATSTTATVLVRSALTQAGVSTTKMGYDQTEKTDSVTAVNGLGDEAYYDTTLGEHSVIKGNNWLLITSGGLMPSDHSQSQASQIAQSMLTKI